MPASRTRVATRCASPAWIDLPRVRRSAGRRVNGGAPRFRGALFRWRVASHSGGKDDGRGVDRIPCHRPAGAKDGNRGIGITCRPPCRANRLLPRTDGGWSGTGKRRARAGLPSPPPPGFFGEVGEVYEPGGAPPRAGPSAERRPQFSLSPGAVLPGRGPWVGDTGTGGASPILLLLPRLLHASRRCIFGPPARPHERAAACPEPSRTRCECATPYSPARRC
jgi:hypothetical protein